MKRFFRWLAWIGLLGSLLLWNGTTAAQTYAFQVPQIKMQVFIKSDSSVRIIYDITFKNEGDTIDVVDIGTPNDHYDISNMSASINGVGLGDIRPSTYIDTGVEVHLDGQAIRLGQQGTLHFEFTMPPGLVYQDTTDKTYASFRITPTWFDPDSVRGDTDYMIAIYLPEGVKPEEVKYQQKPFDAKLIDAQTGLTVVGWKFQDRATGSHIVGVSFPQNGMSNVEKMSLLKIASMWLDDHPLLVLGMEGIIFVLFTILYFRITGGTGLVFYFFFLGALFLCLSAEPLINLAVLPIVIALMLTVGKKLKNRPKRTRYLPAIAEVEGGGIKRGLTAPEAAVLLEMPLNKVLTLVIFGLLEKGVIEQVQVKPLIVRVAELYRTRGKPGANKLEDRKRLRRKAAREQGTVIHDYEDRFLDEIEQHENKPVQGMDFTHAMKWLISHTAKKMKGFDLSDTQEYYRRVMTRAMKQAESLGEIKQREQYLDKYLPWVMLNEGYDRVLVTPGYSYWPRWGRAALGGGSGKVSFGGGGSRSNGVTSLGDVGASFAGWAENTMGGLATAILPKSLQLPSSSGLVDLSGVDHVTGEIFSALGSASGGSGGGGGSCACACAGCACACACAGGGR